MQAAMLADCYSLRVEKQIDIDQRVKPGARNHALAAAFGAGELVNSIGGARNACHGAAITE